MGVRSKLPNWLWLAVSTVLLLVAVFVLYALPTWRSPTAKIDGQAISLEIVTAEREQQRGLMYRTDLPGNHGMLFLYSPPRKVNFWMYHTIIPLDMLFIKDDKIIKIFRNVPPCESEEPCNCARYGGVDVTEVLELKGGYATSHHMDEGDPVEFDRWCRRPSIAEFFDAAKQPFRPAFKSLRACIANLVLRPAH